MESVPSQERREVDDQWRSAFARRAHQNNSALRFESDTPILDETIEIVKEKVWGFRAVLRAAAEALVGHGLSPAVVGYSSVPLGDDEPLAQKNEGEAALQKVIHDEMLSRSSSARSDDSGYERQRGEGSRLVHHEEDIDDSNHAFVEASCKEKDEKKSLTATWEKNVDEDEDYVRRRK